MIDYEKRKEALNLLRNEIKDRFVALRRRLGFTQRQAGEQWNLEPNTINNWEGNRSEPSASALLHISRVENIPFSYWSDGVIDGVKIAAGEVKQAVSHEDLVDIMKELVESRKEIRELQAKLSAAVRGRAEAELRAAALEEALSESRKGGKRTA